MFQITCYNETAADLSLSVPLEINIDPIRQEVKIVEGFSVRRVYVQRVLGLYTFGK
jgi:hypothetical protein